MGSYYSTCSVSHTTIKHQKTSIQLLVPNLYADLHEGRGMLVSDNGAQGLFSYFGFPVHGRYSDCGDLSDIVRDDNVTILEEFFNLSIERILDAVGDDRWYNYGEKENSEHWKLTTLDGTPIRNTEILLILGKTYIRTEILELLEEGWERDIDGTSMKRLKDGYKMANDRVKEFEAIVSDSDKPVSGELHEILDNQYNRAISGGTYINQMAKHDMFTLLDIDIDKMSEHIAKQIRFNYNFGYGMRRILMPSSYGSQDDNYVEITALNKKVIELIESDNMDEFVSNLEYYTNNGTVDYDEFREDYGEKFDTLIEKHKAGAI